MSSLIAETATSDQHESRACGRRRASPQLILGGVLLLLVGTAVLSASVGSAGIPFGRIMAVVGLADGDPALRTRDGFILMSIRLPRIALAISVGALLAAGGTIMQGLFRNPLADPGLIGVSSGAALAVAALIVVGDKIAQSVPFEALPVAAFVGGLVTTLALYHVATREGRTSIATLLLAGLALAALAGAITGLLLFLSDDRQLRDITFWTLGSLAGATWPKVYAIAPFVAVLVFSLPFIAHGLDLLVLGEAEAFHLGAAVERLKRIAIVLVAATVGAAVSVSGVVGFIGIVVPHLLRLLIGPGHRLLLPAAVCFGGFVLLAADTIARTLVAPAELPVGIVTAMLGAPFFLLLLLRQRALVGL